MTFLYVCWNRGEITKTDACVFCSRSLKSGFPAGHRHQTGIQYAGGSTDLPPHVVRVVRQKIDHVLHDFHLHMLHQPTVARAPLLSLSLRYDLLLVFNNLISFRKPLQQPGLSWPMTDWRKLRTNLGEDNLKTLWVNFRAAEYHCCLSVQRSLRRGSSSHKMLFKVPQSDMIWCLFICSWHNNYSH